MQELPGANLFTGSEKSKIPLFRASLTQYPQPNPAITSLNGRQHNFVPQSLGFLRRNIFVITIFNAVFRQVYMQ